MSANLLKFKLSKSIDEWISEADKYSSTYYNKYIEYLEEGQMCPESQLKYYCDISYRYWAIAHMLKHIKAFGSCESSGCIACKSKDLTHIEQLSNTYKKYGAWLSRLQ